MTTTDPSILTICIQEIGGEQMLDPQGTALMYGVEPSAVEALPIIDGAMCIPREWTKRGRRRAKEALAHTGSNFYLDYLRYWASQDHGAELKVVYK